MSMARRLPRGLLIAASGLYALGAFLHRRVGRARARRRPRPACFVLSVGALTVGGAAKTPLAARLAAGLAARGHRVALASRGYKGRTRAPVTVVSDGVHVRAAVAEVGDEALVLAAHAPGVPVLVGRDRRVVGHHAVSSFGTRVLVLDDGFQHHRLARDLDVVGIDGVAGLGNGRVLPAGPLREPASSLRDADWVCVVDGDETPPPGAARLLEDFRRAGRFVLRARRRPTRLRALDGSRELALASLAGRRVGLVSGIARPASFRRTVEALGATVAAERCFADHHAYRAADLRDLDPDVDVWLTTEKDAIKILPSWLAGISLWVVELELELENEAEVLDALVRTIRASGRG